MQAIRINPSTVWSSAGFPFSQAVVEPPGRRVHLTGQVAWTPEGEIHGPGDADRQTHYTIDNIERILAELGGTLNDIVSMTTYYLRESDLPAILEVRRQRFDNAFGPAVTAVQVAGLVDPGLLVEITVVAVIPEERFKA